MDQMAESSEKVVMTDQPLLAYPPIKRIIKQEIPDQQQEVSTGEEENWTLQLPKDPVVMAERPLIAYPPIQRIIKLEILDEHQEMNHVEEENWKCVQVPKDSASSTSNTSANIDLQIVNASLPSDDSRQSKDAACEKGETLQDTEEVSEWDEGSERSEHSSLEDFDECDNSLTAVPTDADEDLISSPKAGPSKEPTRQVKKASHRKRKEHSSSHEAPSKRPFKSNKCELSYRIALNFSCTKCDRQFERKYNLKMHLINVHKIHPDQLNEHGAGSKERSFKCANCDKSYNRKRTLEHHMKHECGIAFSCTLCKQNHAAKCSLRNHLLTVHNIARRQLDKYGAGYKVRPISPFKCDQCGRTFKQKGNLASHLLVECGVEPSFPCPQCDKRFKRKDFLKRHLIEIHNVDRFQLASCGLGLVVRPEKQFKCGQCSKSYKQKESLARHLKKCGK